MPGGAAKRVGRRCAAQHRVGGGNGAIGGAARRGPAVLSHRRRGVPEMPAGAGDDAIGIGRDGAVRKDVGDDLRSAVRQFLPFLPGGFEKVEELRRVHRLERAARRLWRCLGAKVQLVQPRPQQPRPLGALGVALDLAVGQSEDRVVEVGLGLVETFHRGLFSSSLRN